MKIAVMFLVYGAESETAVGSPHHLRVHLQRIRQNATGKVSREQGKYEKKHISVKQVWESAKHLRLIVKMKQQLLH